MVIRNIPTVVRVPFYSEDELLDYHYNGREAFLAREQKLRQMHILKHIMQDLRLLLIRHMFSIFLQIQKKLLRQSLEIKLQNRP
ncbi:hypothetical protein TNCV_674671 [Trichonephila clavipes]|nr:hypothetical protein TNCV_674671 [Trichonephila clavipes]